MCDDADDADDDADDADDDADDGDDDDNDDCVGAAADYHRHHHYTGRRLSLTL